MHWNQVILRYSENLFSGPALADVGEAMKELSEVKDSLDMEVKQNFIDPLQNLHDKDLREIQVLSSLWHFHSANLTERIYIQIYLLCVYIYKIC